MSTTISKQVSVELIECPDCEAFIALTDQRLKLLREGGISFWCPNGHQLSWPKGGAEADRERQRADAAEAKARALAAAQDGLLAAIATKERQLTEKDRETKRIQKRANAGVCLDCHRTFQSLPRHRASKHPEAIP